MVESPSPGTQNGLREPGGAAGVTWGDRSTIPLYQFLREVMTKKRMAWFEPCLRTVAVKPW